MSESQYIKIQNFRCFKDLEVKGFKRVNLIGGKNNAGKTSLLEALLLYFYPIPQSIITLEKTRKGSSGITKIKPSSTWDNLFYNQNIENEINFTGYFNDSEEKKITITVFGSVELPVQNKKINDEDRNKFSDSILQLGSSVATLQIHQQLNKDKSSKRNLFASYEGLSSDPFEVNSIPLVPSSFFISNQQIAQQYDKIDLAGDGEKVLNILKILDPSIIDLRTRTHIEPTLYIQTKTQPRGLPISLFGDAIYRVTAIILELLDKDHKALFIDEIENGIHYTNQKYFWEGLFTLAEELDTLIFATTHSLEMIKAFTAAAKKFPDQGTYFELAYSPRTDKIVAINRDIDLLEYALERGKAIRGE